MIDRYKELKGAFASRTRPEHFTDYNHCEECREHDETLQARDNDSLSFSDVGNITYSPISFLSLEGFLYFLPGLARLAGADRSEYFLDTFLVHLDNDERREALNSSEKEALLNYLIYLKDNITESIEYNLDEEDLEELISWLKEY